MLASWVHMSIAVVFIFVCVLLILVILLQKGRGGGLSGAFGGVGGHSAFGAKTGDVFTWVTVGLTFLFILMAIIGNHKFVPLEPETAEIAVLDSPAGDSTGPSGAEADDSGTTPSAE